MQSRLDRNWRTVDLTPNFITPDDKKFFDDCKLFIGELTKQLTYYVEYFNFYDDDDDKELHAMLKSISDGIMDAITATNSYRVCQDLSEGKYPTNTGTLDREDFSIKTYDHIRYVFNKWRIADLNHRFDEVRRLLNIYYDITCMIYALAYECRKRNRFNVESMKSNIRQQFIIWPNLISLTKPLKGRIMRSSHLPHDISEHISSFISETDMDVQKEDKFVKAWLKEYLKTAYNPNNDYANVVRYFNLQNVNLDDLDDTTLKRDVLPWLGLTDFLSVQKQLITIKKQQAIERPIQITDADTKPFDRFNQKVFSNAWHSMVDNVTGCVVPMRAKEPWHFMVDDTTGYVNPMLAKELPDGLVLRYCNIVRDVAERLAREFHTHRKTITRANPETLYGAICYAVLSLFLGHMDIDLDNSCIKTNVNNNIDIMRIGNFILLKIIAPGKAEVIDFGKYNKIIIDLSRVEPPPSLPSIPSGLGLPHRPPLGGGKTGRNGKTRRNGKASHAI